MLLGKNDTQVAISASNRNSAHTCNDLPLNIHHHLQSQTFFIFSHIYVGYKKLISIFHPRPSYSRNYTELHVFLYLYLKHFQLWFKVYLLVIKTIRNYWNVDFPFIYCRDTNISYRCGQGPLYIYTICLMAASIVF